MYTQKIQNNTLVLNEKGYVTLSNGQQTWQEEGEHFVTLLKDNVSLSFPLTDAKTIQTSLIQTGCRVGIETRYSDFPQDATLAFSTIWWIDTELNGFVCELCPIQEPTHQLDKIQWPGHMAFNEIKKDHVTIFPLRQGALIQNGYEREIDLNKRWELEANYFYTTGACMPWWGQIRNRQGYQYIALTPVDGGYNFHHDAGSYTTVSPVWHSSLGKISHRRSGLYRFMNDCDYNVFCSAYREHLEEKGEIVTLKEKVQRNPKVNALIGSCVVHTVLSRHVVPDSWSYNKYTDEERNFVIPFEKKGEQLCALKEKGLRKAYLHLDAWGRMSYDNQHPDVTPPCQAAGGEEKMAELGETLHKIGYQFGVHDQYRDYYLDAPSYDAYYSVVDKTGRRPHCSLWQGGKQEYLCNMFCLPYVRRNYNWLKEHGIQLDGTYLDVFSCVKLDECYHPEHPQTRTQSMKARADCLEYCRSQGLIISSEEAIGWAMQHLDLIHHAPHAFVALPDPTTMCGKMLPEPIGIALPLVSLVYHDCLVVPWFMDNRETPNNENGMLYALLHGGIPYVDIEATKEDIHFANIVSALHEKVAFARMIHHEYVDNNAKIQKTTFDNGISVVADFANNSFTIYENSTCYLSMQLEDIL